MVKVRVLRSPKGLYWSAGVLACHERRSSDTATGTVALQSTPALIAGFLIHSPLFILVMLQVQLNDIEHCALRIAQDRKPADIRNVGWRNIRSSAERLGFRRPVIAIIDGDVNSP